ncbi:hypothetical protein B484DRAFT_425386, partial [Ochromonadaceae sp. CCMP2298]
MVWEQMPLLMPNMPMGQRSRRGHWDWVNLPLLEVDGQYFVESKAILRYAGLMSNLIPSNPLQQLRMDETVYRQDAARTISSAAVAAAAVAEMAQAKSVSSASTSLTSSGLPGLDSELDTLQMLLEVGQTLNGEVGPGAEADAEAEAEAEAARQELQAQCAICRDSVGAHGA